MKTKQLLILEYPKIKARPHQKLVVWDWDQFRANPTTYVLENYNKLAQLKSSDQADLLRRLQEELPASELLLLSQQGKALVAVSDGTEADLITLNRHAVESYSQEKFVVLDLTNTHQLLTSIPQFLHQRRQLSVEDQEVVESLLLEHARHNPDGLDPAALADQAWLSIEL